MRTADLDYVLPPELVAHRPPVERDGGRLLVVEGDELRDAQVVDLAELIPPGALVVVNDTRVVRARLLGRREKTGGRVEIFLLARLDEGGPEARTARYRALGRASKTLQVGAAIEIEGGELRASVEARVDNGATLEVQLTSSADRSVVEVVERVGRMPLPPYMEREDDETDAERYQTVFARKLGAVAAPTAGLHLTENLLAELRRRDVLVASCTLHVGLGTFQPVSVDDLDDHPMHAETLEVDEGLVRAVDDARSRGAPVVAIGTTVVRALESSADPARAGAIVARTGDTRLLIQPGYRFRVVDALLTNFHLPKSTLLALVQAFGGRSAIRAAYAHAIERRYRFYSYGDAMLIRRRAPAEDA